MRHESSAMKTTQCCGEHLSSKYINFHGRAARVQRVRFFQYTIDLAAEYGVLNTNIVAAIKVSFGRS